MVSGRGDVICITVAGSVVTSPHDRSPVQGWDQEVAFTAIAMISSALQTSYRLTIEAAHLLSSSQKMIASAISLV